MLKLLNLKKKNKKIPTTKSNVPVPDKPSVEASKSEVVNKDNEKEQSNSSSVKSETPSHNVSSTPKDISNDLILDDDEEFFDDFFDN